MVTSEPTTCSSTATSSRWSISSSRLAAQAPPTSAYLVSQGLPTEVRRGHDEALIREYLACLSARGVMDYAFDEAWRHYRFAVAYLMILPVITLNGWDALPERSRALCVKLTDRAVATIDEIDALEVFE